jgi:hypothetical protein
MDHQAEVILLRGLILIVSNMLTDAAAPQTPVNVAGGVGRPQPQVSAS